MDKIELLLEAEKRGLLPPEKKSLLVEARKRGIVPPPLDNQESEKSEGAFFPPLKDYPKRMWNTFVRGWEAPQQFLQHVGHQIAEDVVLPNKRTTLQRITEPFIKTGKGIVSNKPHEHPYKIYTDPLVIGGIPDIIKQLPGAIENFSKALAAKGIEKVIPASKTMPTHIPLPSATPLEKVAIGELARASILPKPPTPPPTQTSATTDLLSQARRTTLPPPTTPSFLRTAEEVLRDRAATTKGMTTSKPIPTPQPLPSSRAKPTAPTNLLPTTPTSMEDLKRIVNKMITPEKSIKERMDIGGLISQKMSNTKDVMSGGWAWLKGAWSGMWNAYKSPPIVTDYKKALGDYLADRTYHNLGIERFIATIPSKISPLHQEAIVNWVEAAGDINILKERAKLIKDVNLRKGYIEATKLPPDLIAFAQDVRNTFYTRLQEAKSAGLLEEGIENYVMHIFENPKEAKRLSALANKDLLNPNPSFVEKRFFNTYFDAEQAGLKAKNKSVGFLIASYEKAFGEALHSRTFVKTLRDLKGGDGRPLLVERSITTRQRVMEGEKTPVTFIGMQESHLPGGKPTPFVNTPDGSTRVYNPDDHHILNPKAARDNGVKIAVPGKISEQMKREHAELVSGYGDIAHPAVSKYKIHPDLLQTWKPGLAKMGYPNLSNILMGSRIRQNPLGRGILNTSSTAKGVVLSLIPTPFHQVQTGTHALFHLVDPFHIRIPFTQSAIGTLPEFETLVANPLTKELIGRGLMVHNSSALREFGEGLVGGGKVTEWMPFAKKYGEYLFGGVTPEGKVIGYIPRLKMSMAHKAFENNMLRYGGKLSRDQILELTASQSNAAFGELNYEWMGRSKSVQDAIKLMFFAPDFLEARLRFAGQAMMPFQKEQLYALMRASAGMFGVARILNMLTNNGDPKWREAFGWVIGDHVFGIRSVPGDIQHLVDKPNSFVHYRLHQLTSRTIIEGVTGRDVLGRKRSFPQQAVDILSAQIPILLSTPLRELREKGVDAHLWKAWLQSVGQSVGVTSYQMKQNIDKRIPPERPNRKGKLQKG